MSDGVDDLPEWYARDLAGAFSAGVASVFLLHGDILGLFPDPDADDRYVPLPAFLATVLDSAEILAFYDVAGGLRFARPAMEKLLVAAAPPADPVQAARAGLQARRGLPREPEECLPLVEKALRGRERVALVIEAAHTIAPVVSPGLPLPPGERATIQRLRNWALDPELRRRRNLVLLVTEQAAKVSPELRLADGGVRPIFIPKPDEAARRRFLGGDAALARASTGLSLRQLDDAVRSAGGKLDAAALARAKRELLNAEYGDVMEVVEPSRGLDDIGGCEHLKRYFRDVLAAIGAGEPRLVPLGVTLMGPPGTGKTAFVEALAREAGFHFVKVRNVRSMWVGESEARMEKLVAGLRALAPVVVMNDEADLAEGGRDAPRGDSGVSERLMKMWMELLADPRIRGRILVVSCTNRPDRLDPALKRSGRSDERILVPMPAADERAAIVAVQLRRHDIPNRVGDIEAIAAETEGLSGADLEKVCLAAYRIARERGSPVDDAALRAAVADFIPGASQAEIDAMTLAGLAECSSRRLLPAHVDELVAGIRARGLVPGLDEILTALAARGVIVPWAAVPARGAN